MGLWDVIHTDIDAEPEPEPPPPADPRPANPFDAPIWLDDEAPAPLYSGLDLTDLEWSAIRGPLPRGSRTVPMTLEVLAHELRVIARGHRVEVSAVQLGGLDGVEFRVRVLGLPREVAVRMAYGPARDRPGLYSEAFRRLVDGVREALDEVTEVRVIGRTSPLASS